MKKNTTFVIVILFIITMVSATTKAQNAVKDTVVSCSESGVKDIKDGKNWKMIKDENKQEITIILHKDEVFQVSDSNNKKMNQNVDYREHRSEISFQRSIVVIVAQKKFCVKVYKNN